MSLSVQRTLPILRMFDASVTTRFYVEYLGCAVDWQDGEGTGPVYMQVSRDGLVLHLSSHHDDGTPGGAVLIECSGVEDLHAELRARGYPFLNPGLEPGPAGGLQMALIDPASNRLRFYERAVAADARR